MGYVADFRNCSVISFNAGSLKQFNEELNTLEIFAFAHDEYEKLSGQWLLDVANRLPDTLKRRYLDYLSRSNRDLKRPGFDSLREFAQHDLSVMSSNYVQTFFRSDGKDKQRHSGEGRGTARVRQEAVKTKGRMDGQSAVKSDSLNGADNAERIQRPRGSQMAPLCFMCNDNSSRHFLNNCPKFNGLSTEDKKRSVVKSG